MTPIDSQARTELSAFIDGIPALVWGCRSDGVLEFANRRFLDYTGFSLDRIRDGWKPALHPEDLGVFEEWWKDLLESPRTGQTEARIRRPDGEYRWFQISAAPVYDEHGTLVRWYGINTEIHDSKCAEQKLRQDQKDLRSITDAIRQSIVVLSPDGTTLYANRVARDLAGLTVGEVHDEGFFASAFHPDDVDRVREERRIGLLEGLPFELESKTEFTSIRQPR